LWADMRTGESGKVTAAITSYCSIDTQFSV
jgi:hypothetical protein